MDLIVERLEQEGNPSDAALDRDDFTFEKSSSTSLSRRFPRTRAFSKNSAAEPSPSFSARSVDCQAARPNILNDVWLSPMWKFMGISS